MEQENYSMFLVTCYTEGFIEIWKFKIILDCDRSLHRQENDSFSNV